MELQQLRYVLAVAETANFTRAAERCHVVQSALSHQIARLERELGVRLFDRTSRSVRLTAAGEAFLPSARECLDAAERARSEAAAASGEVRGSLAIGAIHTVAAVDLPLLLKEFWSRYPLVRLTLVADGSGPLVEKVRRGETDLAFLGLPDRVEPKGVRSRALAGGALVAVAAPERGLGAATDLARLAEEPMIDFRAGTAGRAQSDTAFAAAGVVREVAFEVSTADLMIDLVRQDLGVGLLPGAYVARRPDLHTVSIRDAPTRVEHLVWGDRPSPAAQAFLDLVQAGFAN